MSDLYGVRSLARGDGQAQVHKGFKGHRTLFAGLTDHSAAIHALGEGK